MNIVSIYNVMYYCIIRGLMCDGSSGVLSLAAWLCCVQCLVCLAFVTYCPRNRRHYCFQYRRQIFSVNTISREPLHLAWWNFSTTFRTQLNFKFIGQRSRSRVFVRFLFAWYPWAVLRLERVCYLFSFSLPVCFLVCCILRELNCILLYSSCDLSTLLRRIYEYESQYELTSTCILLNIYSGTVVMTRSLPHWKEEW